MNVNVSIQNALNDSYFGCMFPHFILAVSGGTDSQCLLKAFPHVLKKCRPHATCEAVGVHHGMRSEADAELDLAQELAESQGVTFTRIKVSVPKSGSSVQAKARKVRYEALRGHAKPDGALNKTFIVTAHHFDDRAETVFIRLLRGKNLGSLDVMPVLSKDRVFRPLLGCTRDEILSYNKRWGVKFATDPSNSNSKYLRIKIRNEIMPTLEKLSPRFRQRLNEIADEVRSS